MAFRTVAFGELLLRLSPPGVQRFGQATTFEAVFGGSEANVAVALAQWGDEAAFVTCAPAHDLGTAALNSLRQFGVDTRHCLRAGNRLGLYFLETGAMQRPSRVIYDRAHSALAEVVPGQLDWAAALAGADGFHWTGITPGASASAAAACAEALRAARSQGLRVSADLNYRSKLWQYGTPPATVMPDLVAQCDVVLIDRHAAALMCGVEVSTADNDDQAYAELGRAWQARFPRSRYVAMTRRGTHNASHNTWEGMLWDGTTLHTAPAYELTHIVDRVGGGDAFMAGLLYGLHHFDDLAQTVAFATAASALKHSIPGDFNRVSLDEVMTLVAGDGSGRVIR